MKREKLYSELLALAEQLGIEVRDEKGDFSGGMCRVDDEKYIFLNKKSPVSAKNEIIARAIGKLEFDLLYILPAVRNFIEIFADNSAKS